MKIRLILALVIVTIMLPCGMAAAQMQGDGQAKMHRVRNLDIVGEIAKADQGYIIRGKKPAEIFTILNPDPTVLDAFIKAGKTVRIMVRVVSGDNIEIEKIEGKPYGSDGQKGKTSSAKPK